MAARVWRIVATLVFALAATVTPAGAEPGADPAALAADLVAADQALRNPSAPEQVLAAAARRQQVAYRTLGAHPEWDAVARPQIPASLLDVYDRNIDARRALMALTDPKSSMPPWRVVPPVPANELIAAYRAAEAASGVPWNYLAAINFVETGFGRINGISDDAAAGPMQFLPSTFAAYGNGGDIHSPRDSIMAAGRLLAANGFATNPDKAIWGYNHSDYYVRAVKDYAAVIGGDPAGFAGYYRWDTYYRTTAGDLLLPIGYFSATRIPVEQYLASHPQ
ncbi:lytic transglycosylase domain-containing protein [Mycolicibacter sp. MYC123]|uniref:Lytic transglycosylase domain-containing protein n=2 Tax=Mycolicibacter TaxID=1073531 RepID=A0ABU5YNI6_9MYCO|nr:MULTISPECIES: lytic transglycosylase domain-containing protein [unclassified Mycolicibacter]MEB3050273.1 lytic transglycosylase domain-containing protein [Mycolicibacter sp. MYC123]MEB3069350.1 lytic transglycosylase domain-containing protein [Mycolicibacter sp. MYC017]